MKKAKKSAAKKPAKKSAARKPAAKKSAAKKPAKKSLSAKNKAKAPKKSTGKKLSIAELFELKKKQQEAKLNPQPAGDQTIPPHELHDKVNQQKPQTIVKLRSGPGGTRHH